MLKDKDRIFQNLYNDLGSDVSSSQKRGDWVNTKEITDLYFGIQVRWYRGCYRRVKTEIEKS